MRMGCQLFLGDQARGAASMSQNCAVAARIRSRPYGCVRYPAVCPKFRPGPWRLARGQAPIDDSPTGGKIVILFVPSDSTPCAPSFRLLMRMQEEMTTAIRGLPYICQRREKTMCDYSLLGMSN